jgi:chemotaxis response regulator CheB
MLLLPKLQNLPKSFPLEGAVRIELVEGIPIFRASSTIRERIDALLEKQKKIQLNAEEEEELDLYEDIDDHLSLVNRTVRNIYLNQNESDL